MHRIKDIISDSAKQMVFGKPGLPTGYPELDDLLSGLKPGNLVVIAARPSMGKSALMLNIAAQVAKSGETVVIFTLEMSSQEIVERLIGSEAQVNIPTVKKLAGKLPEATKKLLLDAVAKLKTCDIHIEDGGCLTTTMILAKLEELEKEGVKPKAIFVDYLQLMGTGLGENNRQQEIDMLCANFKTLAKKFGCPVVLLSQLNRQVENRNDHRPRLADLRDSGGIEQAADSVIMIYRPSYYGNKDDDDNPEAVLIVGKNRNGPTGEIPVLWKREFATFLNLGDGQ